MELNHFTGLPEGNSAMENCAVPNAMATLVCTTCAEKIDDIAYSRTGAEYFCPECYEGDFADDIATDAAIDRWHDGYFAKVRPTDPDALAGFLQAQSDRRCVTVEVRRPEGYYHAPLGTFE
jgi:hypothetical protein